MVATKLMASMQLTLQLIPTLMPHFATVQKGLQQCDLCPHSVCQDLMSITPILHWFEVQRSVVRVTYFTWQSSASGETSPLKSPERKTACSFVVSLLGVSLTDRFCTSRKGGGRRTSPFQWQHMAVSLLRCRKPLFDIGLTIAPGNKKRCST